MNIKQALSWTILSITTRYAIKLGGNLTLARLLTPEDFGLCAIVLAIVTGVEAITDVGTRPALIRTHRNDDEWLDTAWTIGVVRGAGIAIAIALAAIPLAIFFKDMRLAPMIAVTGSMSLLIGAQSVTSLTTVRDLQLKRYAVIEILDAILGYVVMLTWAWLMPSAWALLSGALFSGAVFTIASFFAFGRRPIRFRWSRPVVDELVGFGKWVFLGSLMGFFIFQGDRFAVARLISVSATGVYTIAFTWAMSLQAIFGMFLGRLYMPVAAKLWRDLGPRNDRFLSLRRSVLAMMIVPFAFAGGFSDIVIQFLYPNIYSGAGPVMAILVIYGWFSTLEFMYNDQLMISGEPRWRFYAQVISMAVMAGLAAISWGNFTPEWIARIFTAGAIVRAVILIYACDRHKLGGMVRDLGITSLFLALTLCLKGVAIELTGYVSTLSALAIGSAVAVPMAALLAFHAMRRIFSLAEEGPGNATPPALAIEGA